MVWTGSCSYLIHVHLRLCEPRAYLQLISIVHIIWPNVNNLDCNEILHICQHYTSLHLYHDFSTISYLGILSIHLYK